MTIGELVWYITGDTSGLTAAQKKANSEIIKTQEQFKKAGAAIKQVGDKLTDVGKKMTTFVTLPILAAGAASLKFAADYEVANRKFQKAFEGAIPQAEEALQILNEQYGVSISQGTKMLAFTGDLLKGFGATADQALKTSLSVQQLAASLAAYNGVPVEQASQAITTALLGEREALKSLGVVISEEAVSQELMRTGQDKLTGQALLLAKAQATLTLAYQQSGDAVAGMAENQDTLAFQTQKLLGDLKDLAIQVGTILIPYAKAFVAEAQKWVKWFADLNEEQKKGIVIIAGVAAALGPMLIIIGQTVSALGSLAQAMPLIVNAVTALGGAATGASEAMIVLAGSMTAGGFVSTLAVLGPIAAGIATVAYLTYDYAQAQAELNGKVEQAQEIQAKYSDRINMTKEEMDDLVMSMEGFFARNSTEAQDIAAFEQQIRDFAKSRNIEYEVAVRLLENSTALTKEQAEWAKELKREFVDVTQEVANMNVGLATAAYYQAVGTKEEAKRKQLVAESQKKQAEAEEQQRKASLESYKKKISFLDGEAEKRKTESEKILEDIQQVEKWRFNQAKDEEARMAYLADARMRYDEAKKKEDEEAIARAKERHNAELGGGGIGLTVDSGTVINQFGEIENAATVMFAGITKAQADATLQQVNDFSDKYSQIYGIVSGVMGSLQGFLEGITDKRLADNEAAMNRELERAGIIEETEVQRAQRELEKAKEKGDAEVVLEKDKALKKAQIEEEYAKKKKRIEYEGALQKWAFDLGSAIATAPLTVINAMNTGYGAGWPLGLVLGPALAGIAAAASAVQIGTLIANKPTAPKFATGGIVPAASGGQQVIAGEAGNELLLSDGTQGSRLLDGFADRIAARQGSGMMNIVLNIDGETVSRTVAEYMNNGVVTIDLNRAARA